MLPPVMMRGFMPAFSLALIIAGAGLTRSASAQAPQAAPSTAAPADASTTSWSMQAKFVPRDQGWAPVPVEHFRDLIFFKGKINGTDANFLLDNGAPTTVDAAFAQRLGLATTRELLKGKSMNGAHMQRHLVQSGEIEIPHQVKITGPLQVMDFQAVAKQIGHPIDAMLGGDVLKAMALALIGNNLYLVPSGSVQFHGMVANLELVEGDRIAVQLDGKPVTVALDLGSNDVISLSAASWQRIMPPDVKTESGSTSGVEGAPRQVPRSPGHALQVGPIKVDGVTVPNLGAIPDGGEGLLGAPFLSHFNMILDIAAKSLVLTSGTVNASSASTSAPAAPAPAQKQP